MIRLLALLITVVSAAVMVFGFSYALGASPGVAVNCSGDITGFGQSKLPLWILGSGCEAEIQVFNSADESVCTGESPVRNSGGIVPCEGLSQYEGEGLYVEAEFYNESGMYAEDSGDFRY